MPQETYTNGGYTIDLYMIAKLREYEATGMGLGHFLTAVLENNLQQAVAHADSENLKNLPAYEFFMYNHMDSRCWGSPAKVDAWKISKRSAV